MPLKNRVMSYDTGLVIRRDPKFLWIGKYFSEWELDDAIRTVVQDLVGNQRFFPTDPFKYIIHSLRGRENERFLASLLDKSQIITETRTPHDIGRVPFVKVLGNGDGLVSSHLVRVIGEDMLCTAMEVLSSLRRHLGNSPTTVKTKDSQAHFVETISVVNAISSKIISPKLHSYVSIVEAIITAKVLDDALLAFIKRIVEDAYQLERSNSVIPVYVKVLMSDSKVFTFQVGDIKTKRLQVIATMKSAVVEGGEVTLELYLSHDMKSSATAVAADKLRTQKSPSTFIHVVRRYNFSYVDSSTPNNEPRCFAKYPIETLASCVFIDGEGAKAYKALYEKSKKQNNGAKDADSAKDLAFVSLIRSFASSMTVSLNSMDIPVAAEKMLVLYCCMTPTATSPKCRFIQEVSALCTGLSGRVAACKQIVTVLRMSLDALIQRIGRCPIEWLEAHDSPDLNLEREKVSSESNPAENEEKQEVLCLRVLYEQVSQSFDSLRIVLLALLNDSSVNMTSSSCEFAYVKTFLANIIWQLFDSETRTRPLVDRNPWRISAVGLSGISGFFSVIDEPLRQLEVTLALLGASISADILDRLLVMEKEAALTTSQPQQTTKSRDSTERAATAGVPFSIAPRTFGELLGYCIGIQENRSSWSAVDVTIKPPPALGGGFYYSSATSLLSKAENENASSANGCRIWHTHRTLGNNWVGRLEAVDFQASLVQYLYSQDGPSGMSSEGVVLRYLVESNVIPALKDACFVVLMQPDRLQPYSSLCRELFRRSAEKNLFRLTNNSINTQMSRDSRTLQSRLKALHGAARIPLLLDNAPAHAKPRLQGGVIGPDEVLSKGLGDWRSLYRFMWTLPAILPNRFVSPSSQKIDVYMGLSLESALQLSKPNIFSVSEEESPSAQDYSRLLDTDPDLGLLRHPGLVKLESVVRIEFDSLEKEAAATSLFADECLRSILYMDSSSHWILRDILFSSDGSSGVLAEKQSGKAKILAAEGIGKNSNFQSAIKRFSSKNGELIVDCAFAAPHEMASMPFDDLLKVMQTMLEKNTEKAGYLSGAIHEPAATDYGDDEDDWGVHSKPSSTHLYHSDVQVADVDPTVQEKYRIYSSDEKSAFQVSAQNFQKKRMAALKIADPPTSATVTYIPCQIRFTLLGVCLSSRRHGQRSQAIYNQGPSVLDRSSSDGHAPWLCIGRDDTVAALVASTLWFSLDAGKAIWEVAAGATAVAHSSGALGSVHEEGEQASLDSDQSMSINIARCFASASSSGWKKAKDLMDKDTYFEAYQALYLPVLFSSQTHLVAPVVRMSRSLPSKLKAVIDCSDVIVELLGRETTPSINMLAFGHSVARDIVLTVRALVMSPQSVHLRGGCALLLKTLDIFEAALQLGGMKLEQMYSIKDLVYCPLATKGGKGGDSVRQVFGMKKNTGDALEALLNIRCMCRLLMHATAKDVHSNCLFDLREVLESYPGTVVDPMKLRSQHLKQGLKMAGRKMMLISSSKANLKSAFGAAAAAAGGGGGGGEVPGLAKESLGPPTGPGREGGAALRGPNKWGHLRVLGKAASHNSVPASNGSNDEQESTVGKRSDKEDMEGKGFNSSVQRPRKMQSVTNMIRMVRALDQPREGGAHPTQAQDDETGFSIVGRAESRMSRGSSNNPPSGNQSFKNLLAATKVNVGNKGVPTLDFKAIAGAFKR